MTYMLPKGYDLADSDFALKVTVTATHLPSGPGARQSRQHVTGQIIG